MRSLLRGSNKHIQTIDIRYQSDAVAGWVPVGWEMIYQRGKEELQEKWIGTVNRCVVNIPIPPREFEIEFPPNSRVTNEITKEEYIVKPTGAKRSIPPEDIGTTYEKLINTEPGAANRDRPLRRLVPWAIGVVGCSLVGFGLWWLNRRKRRSISLFGELPVQREV
jgi:hypothetical protein